MAVVHAARLGTPSISGTDQYLFVGEEGNGGRVLPVNLSNNSVRTVVNDGQIVHRLLLDAAGHPVVLFAEQNSPVETLRLLPT